MKKHAVLLTTMLCLMFAFGLNAKAGASGNLKYTIQNGTAVITGCIEKVKRLHIPSSIAGYKVTEIGPKAFYNDPILTYAILPSNVEIIGESAFAGCNKLLSVDMPDSVKSIKGSAFRECCNLVTITIPGNNTTIAGNAFSGCSRLKSLTLQDGVTVISERAFYRCPSLTSVAIPKSVPLIGASAFGFTFDEIAGEERKIPDFTIEGYTGSAAERYAESNGFKFIQSDPSTAENHETTAVKKPTSQTTNVSSTHTAGKNRYLITSKSTVRYESPVSREITSIRIPERVTIHGKKYKVTAIAGKAFFNCRKLKKVIINSPIRKIGKYAFYKCKKLKTIRIYSKKLTRSGVLTGAFKGISRKATFYVPKGKKAAYRKILLKRGAKKTMKFKFNSGR